MGDFKDLEVWKRSRELSAAIYDATGSFPASELGGLVSQLRRGGVSIGANIAEGTARHTRRDQARFYRTSLASAREVEALLLMSLDTGFLTKERHDALARAVGEIQRMLSGLVRYALSEAGRKRRQP